MPSDDEIGEILGTSAEAQRVRAVHGSVERVEVLPPALRPCPVLVEDNQQVGKDQKGLVTPEGTLVIADLADDTGRVSLVDRCHENEVGGSGREPIGRLDMRQSGDHGLALIWKGREGRT